MKTKWDVRTYDVWGNEDDGFYVNDIYRIGEVELDNDPSDADVIFSLKGAGILNGFATVRDYEFDGDDTVIYLNVASNSRPVLELTKQED